MDCYTIQLDIHLTPSDALIGRVYRETRRMVPSVIPVRKIKSLVAAQAPKVERSVAIGGEMRLEFQQDFDAPVASLIDYYWGLRILSVAYAICGTHQVDSKDF